MEEIIKYLGNFHPVILHLPIGAFLFTLLLFIYQKFSKIDLTIPVRLGLIFSFVSAIISSILGFILQYYSGDKTWPGRPAGRVIRGIWKVLDIQNITSNNYNLGVLNLGW